jgi:hypothetical protein
MVIIHHRSLICEVSLKDNDLAGKGTWNIPKNENKT